MASTAAADHPLAADSNAPFLSFAAISGGADAGADDRGASTGAGAGRLRIPNMHQSAQGLRTAGARSSYYWGPPDAGRAFGTAPVGVIGRDKPREIIRVERDYGAGELCQFHPAFPLELEGRISPTTFAETINEINLILIEAHDSAWSCFDNALAVLTLWISPLVLGSHYSRAMRRLDQYIHQVNLQVFNPAGLEILFPRNCAFLFLEIEYY
ncbi:hypothetical protein OC846_004393 [Tilletia horrida]|uniref:Ras modification protein ERF4 n=1 Tax=Tilletia horrida TaxID=155126 RepID=A0AAN6JR64_9BASI|nr:hypothetical protein OC845_006052 [Tilletia horrida]KAK0548705.1 hypothetical protein OC846_004393 [Tilletia horrida]KAK0566944.1 hypothetical protein OC861_002987 [Tilletia horrida]